MRICASVISRHLGVRISLELDQGSVRWKDMKVWSDWLVMKTAWFDNSRSSLFLPSFFLGLFLSRLKREAWFWMFYSCTLTLRHLYKSHLLTHSKVTFTRVTYSRGLFATYRVLTRVTVRACTAGWALHTRTHRHTNIHIINTNTLITKYFFSLSF